MRMWGVTDADAATYIANEAMAKLDGTTEQKLENCYSEMGCILH